MGLFTPKYPTGAEPPQKRSKERSPNPNFDPQLVEIARREVNDPNRHFTDRREAARYIAAAEADAQKPVRRRLFRR